MKQDTDLLDDEAERIVRDIGIPPCPAILTKLLKETRNDEPDYRKLAELISGDVGLAAAMLKTVNSPFFGLRAKATSVQQALTLLGLQNVVQLVTALLLRMAFPSESNGALEDFWETSTGIAQVTARLARPLARLDRDEAYTFALFRDCGIPLMMRKYPAYSAFLADKAAVSTRGFTEAEQERFQMDHARVGYQLATSWHLPEDTCVAIHDHHEYPEAGTPPDPSHRLVALSLSAELLYSRNAGIQCPEWAKGKEFVLSTLGITEADLDEYTEDVSVALSAS